MSNPEPKDKFWRRVRTPLVIAILVIAALGLLFGFILNAESAPQQTVQELRFIKWLLVAALGLLILKL